MLLAIFLVDPLRLLLRITLKAVFTSCNNEIVFNFKDSALCWGKLSLIQVFTLKEVLGSVSRYPARVKEEVEDLFPYKNFLSGFLFQKWGILDDQYLCSLSSPDGWTGFGICPFFLLRWSLGSKNITLKIKKRIFVIVFFKVSGTYSSRLLPLWNTYEIITSIGRFYMRCRAWGAAWGWCTAFSHWQKVPDSSKFSCNKSFFCCTVRCCTSKPGRPVIEVMESRSWPTSSCCNFSY